MGGGEQVGARTVYGVNGTALGYETYSDRHERPRHPRTANHRTEVGASRGGAYQSRSQREYVLAANNSVSLVYFQREL